MSDLLENVFLFIPLAMVVFARVFITALRNRTRTTRTEKQALSPPRAAASWRDVPRRFLERLTSRPATAAREPQEIEQTAKRRYERPAPPPARLPAAPPRLVDESRPAPDTGRKRTFPEALERLPPLQKAVALSEILGPPRSLRD